MGNDDTAQRTARTAPPTRARPKDRRVRIAAVAAEYFSAYGYHGTGMDGIAAAVGISGPALYRHFPSKYALFRGSVEELVGALEQAVTDSPGVPGDAAPADRLAALLESLADVAADNRRSGGLYRWQARFLHPEDRRAVADTMRGIVARIEAPVRALHPELSPAEVRLRGSGSLSVLGSITGHRAVLARTRMVPLLVGGSLAVIDAPGASAEYAAPGVSPLVTARPGTETGPPPASDADRREALLVESVRQFARRGYHEASIDDIASAAGMTASGVYRYFDGKAALLDAAYARISSGLGAAQSAAITDAASPVEALAGLIDLYVRRGLRHSDQMVLYFAEAANLPPRRRRALTAAHRRGADEWAQLLVQVRPELPHVQARFLVHAAFALILDTGRVLDTDRALSPAVRADLRRVVTALLFDTPPAESP